TSSAMKKYFAKAVLTEWKPSVMWPRHSVWVMWEWGLNQISLKLVDPPWATCPTKPSWQWGSILGGSRYQAFTFFFPPLRAMEISRGLERSILYNLALCCRVAIIIT